MSTSGDIVTIIIGIAAIAGICYYLYGNFRKPLQEFLSSMVHSNTLAEKGTFIVFGLIFISAAREAIYMIDDNSEILRLLKGVVNFLSSAAGEVRWMINIAVMLLIAYTINTKLNALTKALGQKKEGTIPSESNRFVNQSTKNSPTNPSTPISSTLSSDADKASDPLPGKGPWD